MHTKSWQSVGLTLDECIKCNICTSYCPVAAVTDLFPGPKYVGPQAQRFRENGQPNTPDHSVDYCSGCRVCNEVCPTGVQYHRDQHPGACPVGGGKRHPAAQPAAGTQ